MRHLEGAGVVLFPLVLLAVDNVVKLRLRLGLFVGALILLLFSLLLLLLLVALLLFSVLLLLPLLLEKFIHVALGLAVFIRLPLAYDLGAFFVICAKVQRRLSFLTCLRRVKVHVFDQIRQHFVAAFLGRDVEQIVTLLILDTCVRLCLD